MAAYFSRHSRRTSTSLIYAAAVAIVCLTAVSTYACNVPVFRYALEKWTPGPYEVVIFYKDEFTADQQDSVKLFLEAANSDTVSTNILVKLVDLNDNPPPHLIALHRSLKSQQLPLTVVRYPAVSRLATPFWSGPLTKTNAKALIDSPARRKVSDQILKGTSAVWLLLKCGDKAKDDAAFKLLTTELKQLEKELKLPELTDSPEDELAGKHVPLKLKFSVFQLDRNDAAERVFIDMLINSEPEEPGIPHLRTYNEPMVFPIFGRGRALYALVGKGINENNIYAAARFLTGPCTCTVKEKNPGIDLLTTAPWDSILSDAVVKEKELPPLIGIAKLKTYDVDETPAPPPSPRPMEKFMDYVKTQVVFASRTVTELDKELSVFEKFIKDVQMEPEVDPQVVEDFTANEGATVKKGAPNDLLSGQADKMEPSSADSGATSGDADTKPVQAAAQGGDTVLRNTLISIFAGIVVVAAVFFFVRVRGASRN